ncbi:MAG: hypothetical protein QM725_06155 [Lacibacter sp.]
MKDGKTILLLIVSVCLVATWGYHIYDKNNYSVSEGVQDGKDSAGRQRAVNDSLQRNYTNALIRLGTVQVDKDSINSELRNKVHEIDSLRDEISLILGISNITRNDLNAAEEKINLLQQKLVQLRSAQKTTGRVPGEIIPVNEKKVTAVVPPKNNSVVKDGVSSSGLFTANASIRAIQTGTNEQTTSKADAAEVFTVSCSLQSNTVALSREDIFIVLTAPGGRVIQDDQWQGGMFATVNGGRLPYTRKSVVSCGKGETKRIVVSIKPTAIDAGLYSVQIYHKGQRVARADIKLN